MISRSEQSKAFWNNWDFKTILIIVQLVGVIWLVATTYAKLDAKVDAKDERIDAKVESYRKMNEIEMLKLKEDLTQIKSDVSDIRELLYNPRGLK